MKKSLVTILALLFALFPQVAHADARVINIPGDVPNLQAANDLLCAESCDGIGQAVKIVIAPGTYTDWSTLWTYSDPQYPTQIVGNRVTISGGYSKGWGMTIHPNNTTSNIQIFYINWVAFKNGGIVQEGGGNDKIYKNTFSRIGSYYTKQPDIWGYAGVMWKNVNGSTVDHSEFTNILNTGDGYGHEHGVYIVNSDGNNVTASQFTNVGGDPIRIRNHSNSNNILNNVFTTSGSLAYIGDWQCIENEMHPECPDGNEAISWHNEFKGNILRDPHPWHLGNFRPAFCYDQSSGICSQQRVETR